ncbi:MAG: nucleotidyltransferase family protein [Erysipelotrichaceae bacterium]|nr:nucleotidyltransferase family protein [Erysipelotrichaceae bacterium]
MDNLVNINTCYDVVYLLQCALFNCAPDKDKIEQMDMDSIKKIGYQHKINGLLATALEKTDDSDYWKKEKNKSIRRTMMFDAERAELFDFLENNHIWYLPLKGIIISRYYPEYGIRDFSDNDILFDQNYQEMVYEYFTGRGYDVKTYKSGNLDIYVKPPVYNFEMHISLFNKYSGQNQLDYYENLSALVKHIEGKSELRLDNDDFYVYFMAHSVKHYSNKGTGLRTLVDTYLLNKKLNLNLEYINKQFAEMDILKEAEELKDLAIAVFDNLELTEDQKIVFEKICFMGAYGNYQTRVDNHLARKTKLKYLSERIFIPADKIKFRYPLVYKYRILLPGFYLYRIIKGVINKGSTIFKEFRYVVKHK